MPKLPVLKPRQVIAALEKAGFRQVRQKGSHIQFKRGNLLVTVPNHPGDVNPQVLRSILRQSQMTTDEFIELMK
ncbi:MAG TPA: type II toxin-antitoxin system HicA family toxin [Anaerolineales bacterium]|jgi:predicted RNA binding protein YcfA (HicA-like mRNA interferase family)|nr:type II toxin-antitoxin system HicA family toxin [Anaerolineales bacterium]HQX16578.1 type II toxin-antitoxin system HicA family toxin [Anaerolineales bacterium]